MAQGLPVSDVISVDVVLAPLAAGYQNFGLALFLGSSNVIDTSERVRSYSTMAQVASDFSSTSAEFKSATLYFSQSPQPRQLLIGRWAQTATAGLLRGGALTPSQRLISNFTAVTNGSLSIMIDGTAKNLTGLNFAGQTNLNGVASVLQAALVTAGATGATVQWDANSNRFTVTSGTTGTSSSVGYATAPGSGTDVGPLFGLTSGVASAPIAGLAPESLISAVSKLADVSSAWYALIVATPTPPQIADHLAVAAFIEASNRRRIYGVTITTTDVLDPTRTDDLASQLKSFGYSCSFTQYSSSSPYAVASFIARPLTVNWNANNSAITVKFKQEPGVQAEYLTETQAQTLKAKNCNVFVQYENGTAIIQEGVMANGQFFDEHHGLDWLQNRIQNDLWNLFLQSATKIPQTDGGNNIIINTVNGSLAAGVNNGLLAPGQWNADGFGQLARGDLVPLGYYTYMAPIRTQSQADRETRVSVPIQVAAKGAGAIHYANVILNFNR